MAGYIVAGCVAALLGGIEQYNRLNSRFTLSRGAWSWWIARLLLEAGVGCASLAIGLAAELPGADGVLGWIAAGAAGPAAVRVRVLDLGRGEASRPVGLASFYEPVRGLLERQIDDIGAEEQSRWVNEEVLPGLAKKGTTSEELGKNIETYLQGLSRISASSVAREISYIRRTLAGGQEEPVKRELLARQALDLEAYRLLKRLL